MFRKFALVAVCATALVTLAATQANAYPDRGSGVLCSSGSSGTVCAHEETDIGSGHIRARGAADANAGSQITITRVTLQELTTEVATGQLTVSTVISTTKKGVSTGAVVSVIAGPVEEQCDSRLATFQWRAEVFYTTSKGNFHVISPWASGAC